MRGFIFLIPIFAVVIISSAFLAYANQSYLRTFLPKSDTSPIHSVVPSITPVPTMQSATASTATKAAPTPTSKKIPTVVLLEISFVGVDNLHIGDAVNLEALATYSDGKRVAVKANWSVEGDYLDLDKNHSPTSVQIEPRKAGVTSITATFEGKKATRSFTITNPQSVDLAYSGSNEPFAYSVGGYGEYHMKITYKDSYSYPEASWSAENNCATLQPVAYFRVKATFLKSGECKISASYKTLSVSKTISVLSY